MSGIKQTVTGRLFPATYPVMEADAIIRDGTIIHYDFSRPDCYAPDGDLNISQLTNLAASKATALGLALDAPTGIGNASEFSLTTGGGLTFDSGASLNFGAGLNDYAYNGGSDQPDLLISFWTRMPLVTWNASGYFFKWGNNTTVGGFNHWVSMNDAGGSNFLRLFMPSDFGRDAAYDTPDVLAHVVLTKSKEWVDGLEVAADASPGPYIASPGNLAFLTSGQPAASTIFRIYRFTVDDLGVSARTAVDFIAAERAYMEDYHPGWLTV